MVYAWKKKEPLLYFINPFTLWSRDLGHVSRIGLYKSHTSQLSSRYGWHKKMNNQQKKLKLVIKALPSKFKLPSANISLNSCLLDHLFEEPEMAVMLWFVWIRSSNFVGVFKKCKKVNFVEIGAQIWYLRYQNLVKGSSVRASCLIPKRN